MPIFYGNTGNMFDIKLARDMTLKGTNKQKKTQEGEGSILLHRPFILLIDDDDEQLMVFKFLLQENEAGCDVITAKSGFDALEILSDVHVDLVICDINMPNMSGRELISHIRNGNSFVNLPIIAFSAGGSMQIEREALDCGADIFCPKTNAKLLLKDVAKLLDNLDTSMELLAQIRLRFEH